MEEAYHPMAMHDTTLGVGSGSLTSQTDQQIMLNMSEWPDEHKCTAIEGALSSNPTPTVH